MKGWMVRLILGLAGALALAACSMQSMMEAMSTPEERQFAQDFVANLRSGNEAWFRERMAPYSWERSESMFAARRGLFPPERGRTTLTSYSLSVNRDPGGRTVRSVSYALVTEAGGQWIETRFDTLAEDGAPQQVSQWSVVPLSGRPPELAFMEASEKAVPWMWGFAALLLAVIAGIVWAIVRSSRRKRAEWESSRQGGRPHG